MATKFNFCAFLPLTFPQAIFMQHQLTLKTPGVPSLALPTAFCIPMLRFLKNCLNSNPPLSSHELCLHTHTQRCMGAARAHTTVITTQCSFQNKPSRCGIISAERYPCYRRTECLIFCCSFVISSALAFPASAEIIINSVSLFHWMWCLLDT